MKYSMGRFIPNFFSTTVVREKFPFFVIPLSLMIFLMGFFLWTFFKVGNKSTRNTIDYIDSIINSSPNKMAINNNNSLQWHEKQYYLGLDFFANKNFTEAIDTFKSLYLQRNLPSYMHLRVGVYYAYSLLVKGEQSYNNRIIQDSRDVFADLYNNYKDLKDPLFLRVIAGYAKSLRLLNTFQLELISYLKQSTIKVDDSMKRQIFLELGYLYAVSDRFKEAQDSFLRAALPITSTPLFAKLLTNNNAIHLTINLIRNNLVPKYLHSRVLSNLQIQMLTEATQQYGIRNIPQATMLLKNILAMYPTGAVKDNANYLLAYYSQSSGNYQSALHYYKNINGSNAQLNLASLYQMGMINLKENNIEQARRYFYTIINQNSQHYYAQLSYAWIKKIESGLLGTIIFDDSDYYNKFLPTLNQEVNQYALPFQSKPLEVYMNQLKPLDMNEDNRSSGNQASQPVINFNVQNGISDSNNQANPRTTTTRNSTNTIYKPDPQENNSDEIRKLKEREQELIKEAQQREKDEKIKLENDKMKLEDANRRQQEEIKILEAQRETQEGQSKDSDIFEEEEEYSSSESAFEKDFGDLSKIVSKKF